MRVAAVLVVVLALPDAVPIVEVRPMRVEAECVGVRDRIRARAAQLRTGVSICAECVSLEEV